MIRLLMTCVRIKLTSPFKLIGHNLKFFEKASRHFTNFSSNNVYVLDEDTATHNDIVRNVNKYTKRTHTCGELRINDVGLHVELYGWLEFQRINKFIVLRDGYGVTQLLIPEEEQEIQQSITDLPFETILRIKGTVLARPVNMKNKKQPTGDIEVKIESLHILNKARTKLPFNIREFQKAKESLRMQYRYLDLRFPIMQRNLRVRSEMMMKMRQFLISSGFVDVETPTLFKATPGGAQEFVVPTRFPGQFYSLVQSPQQFKQMLMAGAIDRYFQIARCYRDEGSRPDRQPEFTQLDVEMSFSDLDGILGLVEDLLSYCWPPFLPLINKKFHRMTFNDAMELYGSDQPDTRFEFKLKNCTEILSSLKSEDGFGAYCLIFPKELILFNNSIKGSFVELAKKYPATTLVQSKISAPDEFITKVSKRLPEDVTQKLMQILDLNDCLLFLAYGNKRQAQNLLGKIRLEYVDHLEENNIQIRKNEMHLLWIIDMPLFETGAAPYSLVSAHHPFTSPNLEDLHLLDTSPLQVRSLSFDLVLNGNEIGGGSVRIHDPNLQSKIFEKLKINPSSMQHIIDMLASGCPPHGGIALGIDRLLSKILNTISIRDVIAFPKNFDGRDALSGAPSSISENDQKRYHIIPVFNK